MPNDSPRIADETSLLVMDIVVMLEDGSIANVEIQKIGYTFPGQRSACYSADLLLRQYKLVRSQKPKKEFSYKDIKTVYTIVFFEKSTQEFHEYEDEYIHSFQQRSDTGLELDLLQKFVFIPLDIYKKKRHNIIINNRLDAWLLFPGSDDSDDIISIITSYPDFKAMYEQVYEICRNVEGVMGMFSEELRILDRNTVRYMMDELQNEIDQQRKVLSQLNEKVGQRDEELSQKEEELSQAKVQLQQALERIRELEKNR